MTTLEVIQNLGLFSVGVTGLSWLARQIFLHFFDKDLEKFKSELEKSSIEFRIRYEKLHGERVDVIKEVYKRISKTYRSFYSLICPLQMAGEPTQEEKAKIAAENANFMIDYYEENRIFFEESLAKDIDSLFSDFRQAWNDFQSSIDAKRSGESRNATDGWRSAWHRIEGDVPKIKTQLEKKFRDILGIIEYKN